MSCKVSDGIIAPGYNPDALEVLKKKKGGKYCILQVMKYKCKTLFLVPSSCLPIFIGVVFQMDPNYEPSPMESRTIFGLHLEQLRNNCIIDENVFKNIKTKQTNVCAISLVL